MNLVGVKFGGGSIPGAIWMLITRFGRFMLLFALASIMVTTRSLFRPLARLDGALRRIVDIGDLHELGRIPVEGSDEVGALTSNFNAMLDVFEHLAQAAQSVSEGDLSVEVSGHGDLQDAFRSMVERLNELVVQIRDIAIEVASGAAEIQSATRRQESAAITHSDGVGEVSDAMRSLAESATDISDTVIDSGAVATRRQSRCRCARKHNCRHTPGEPRCGR